jgi:hypothetical protein
MKIITLIALCLAGCTSHNSMPQPFVVGYMGPVCETDLECETLYYGGSTLVYDGYGHEVHSLPWAGVPCESDPDDLLDLQECE